MNPKDCPHTTVKCLCCGVEGTPAQFMGKRKKTMTDAAREQRRAAGKTPKAPRKKPVA